MSALGMLHLILNGYAREGRLSVSQFVVLGNLIDDVVTEGEAGHELEVEARGQYILSRRVFATYQALVELERPREARQLLDVPA